MSDGWIKLHRKILDNPILDDSINFSLFVRELLMKATHKPHRIEMGGKEVVLQPGQVRISFRALARVLAVGVKVVRGRIDLFQKRHMVEVEKGTHGTIVTICNWGKYQIDDKEEGTPRAHPRAHQGHTKGTHNKKSLAAEPSPTSEPSFEPPNSMIKKEPSPGGDSSTLQPTRPHKMIAEKMIKVFNHHLGDVLARARVTSRRVRTMSTALKDDFEDDPRQWSEFCERVSKSDFLTGRKADWRASLDWVIKPANRIKILEGNYDNRSNGHDKFNADRLAREIGEEIARDGEHDGFGNLADKADKLGQGDGEHADRPKQAGGCGQDDGQASLQIPSWFDQAGD